MKISLVILQSINGFIAKEQSDTLQWGSIEDRQLFNKLTTEADVVIMGSLTYKKMLQADFSKRFGFVMTSNPQQFSARQNVEFFNGSAQEAVQFLEEKGIKKAALIGGGNINAQFLQAGLIDDAYITIAPYIFSSGIKAFGDFSGEAQFELLETSKLGEGEILLHYQIIKS